MLRRFRFGFLSLFAAMLLLVSAAGWWKFHRDLYVEEIEALKTLRGAGLTVNVRRAEDAWAEPPEDEEAIPWNAPLIAPLQIVSIDGKPTAEERNAALALPRLTNYSERPTREQEIEELQEIARGTNPEPFDLASFLGGEFPQLAEAELDYEQLDAPIPNGEPVDEAEADRIAQAILAAWRAPDATPQRYLTYAWTEYADPGREGFGGTREAHFTDGERALRHSAFLNPVSPESLSLISEGVQRSYTGRSDDWKRDGRIAGYDVEQFREQYRRYPDDDFPYHGLNFHNWQIVGRTFDAMPQYELARVEKIDDARYRVDFAPFAGRRIEANELKSHAVDPKVIRWECVLRSDLDWAPEEVLLVQEIQYGGGPKHAGAPKPEERERRLVQRFVRQDGRVLISKRLSRDRIPGGPTQAIERVRYAHDLDPQIPESAFDPATLDSEVWPDPRPLPVLRWYRVTFALSLALFAFLIVRSLASILRRRTVASDAADHEADDVIGSAQT